MTGPMAEDFPDWPPYYETSRDVPVSGEASRAAGPTRPHGDGRHGAAGAASGLSSRDVPEQATASSFERRRLRVYVAGPLSKGDLFDNVALGIRWGKRMIKDGLAPFIPHLDAYMFMGEGEVSWNAYLEWDLEWSTLAEAVFRIDGESRGADLEVSMANQHGIPVFWEKPRSLADHDYDDLLAYASGLNLNGRRK